MDPSFKMIFPPETESYPAAQAGFELAIYTSASSSLVPQDQYKGLFYSFSF